MIATLQQRYAVLSFRVMARGSYKWAHGGRRGYYRLQINTVPYAVRINSPLCLSERQGPHGLEQAGARSAYCLDSSLAQLQADAARINAAQQSAAWARAMQGLALAMIARSTDG